MAALGHLVVGSVTLGSARKAARAAKSESLGTERRKVSPVLTERYLGHFGSAKKSGAKKTASSLARKSGAKKTVAAKKVRAYVGKKTSAKKAASFSRKR